MVDLAQFSVLRIWEVFRRLMRMRVGERGC